MNDIFEVDFNAGLIAEAIGFDVTDSADLMTDGRCATFIIQRRLVADHPDWNLVPSAGGAFNLQDPHGGIWKVKSLTAQGLDFKPSVQIGFGRAADEPGFVAAWNAMTGFIVADVTRFPKVRIERVPIGNILQWYSDNLLGSKAKASYGKYNQRLRPLIQYDLP